MLQSGVADIKALCVLTGQDEEQLRSALIRHGDDCAQVTVLVGEAAIGEALEAAGHAARDEILSMHPHKPLGPEQLAADFDRSRRVLERGVRIRTIHCEAMENIPHGALHLRRLHEAGAVVRLAPALPLRLILVDARLGYISIADRDEGIAVLEVRSGELVHALRELFEYCWTVATTSYRVHDESTGLELTQRESTLLRMLAGGMKDEAVARSLGISTRTLRRFVSQILDKIGAASRFQAGVKIAELGLLHAPASPPRGTETRPS